MTMRSSSPDPPAPRAPEDTWAVRVYRLCLLAFPPDVRAAHGKEMVDVFAALVARRRQRTGWASAAWLTLRGWAEAVTQGVRSRHRRRRAEGRRGRMLDDLWTDLRHTLRSLSREPLQAGVLVVTLALGVGATTAIFSVLHGVLYTPLPYADPHELVSVEHRATLVDGTAARGPGGRDLLDYIERARTVEAFGGVQTLESNLNDDEGAARVTMGWITPDFFQVVGVRAELGRVLRPDDWVGAIRERMEDPTFTPPPMAVLLGHGLWTRRFGSDRNVVGRSLRLNGQSMEVVGVLPDGFGLHLPADAQVSPDIDAWAIVPVPLSDAGRGVSGMNVIARLADGATVDQARSEMAEILEGLTEEHEVHARLGTSLDLTPLHDRVVGAARTFLWPLFGAVSLLLLIACTNVANLLLVRAAAREREFAVRAALGVARGRIVRQLLTESLVVAVLGTGAGLLVARWAGDLLVRLAPGNLPRLDAVALDGTVLTLSVVVSLAVAIVFGLAPALTSAQPPSRVLVSSRGSGGGGRASVRLRRGLVMAELAVSVVLVVGAGLLFRSFGHLRDVDLGVDPTDVLAVDVAVPFFPYREDLTRAAFFLELAQRAQRVPGVRAAGVTARLPLEAGSGGTWNGPYGPGGTGAESDGAPRARYRPLSPGAMEALGIRVLEGRALERADEQPADPVPVVVDARLAALHWPQGALGRTLQVQVAAYTGQDRLLRAAVVGVTEPVRFTSVATPDEPTIYLPYHLFTPVDGTLVIETDREPAEVAADVRAIVAQLDATVPVFSVRRFVGVVDRATADARHALWLMAIFAATALVLAGVGLYGVVSTLVQQRTREIGVRLAMGAVGHDIARMIGRDGARMVVPGLVLGLVGAVIAGPVLGSLLFGVGPLDPATLLGTAAVLGAVATFASTLPAVRAARMHPVDALRED